MGLGLADGDSAYDELEKGLARGPVIAMPTTTLEGDASGAPHPDPTSYAGRFGTTCPHRTMVGGIGHNLSQEAPEVLTDAVFTVGALR